MANKKFFEEELFEKPPSKTVFAYDIHENKVKTNLNKFKFRISAYGILEENGKVLLNRNPAIQKFGLPGGGVRIGDSLESTLKREFLEETGLKIKIEKLLYIDKNLFTVDGSFAHGILIFYKVGKISGKLTPNNEDSVEVKWFNKNELSKKIVHRSAWPSLKKYFSK